MFTNPSTKTTVLTVLPLLFWTALAKAQSVPYEKYRLDNGMTVILHEDHGLPVAQVNIWYQVGSKDELPGRSGFAHLFEHLMFMGTERVPEGQFDALMEAGGGANNATTSSDRTNYFSWGPSSLLPTLLWLEADRLEDLGRMMTQEKLDAQRDVVRNERRQTGENRPYGRAGLAQNAILYPPGHPYHTTVIGSHEDLEAATVADVKNFFAQYYAPSNASLVVAGDFDPKPVKSLIADLFGSLPAGSAPEPRSARPAELDGVKRLTMLDKVQLPLLSYVYHSPAYYAEGDAEMDLLASVLSEGKSSRLYRKLIYEDQLAAQVDAYQSSGKLGSLFTIRILARPETDLNELEGVIDAELERLLREGIEAQELEPHKSTYELSGLQEIEDLSRRADRLNMYEAYFGEPDSFARDLDRYRKATPESVHAWARRVLLPDARLIVRVLPEEPGRPTTARDSRPEPLAGAGFELPAPNSSTLSNGIRVHFWHRPGLPMAAVRLLLDPASSSLDPPGKAGLSALTADMLDEGTGAIDALSFGRILRRLGAEFSAVAQHETIEVSLLTLARSFPEALDLMARAVAKPSLSESDWERVRRLHLEDLKQSDDRPTSVAARVGMRLLFGDEHPYAWPVDGTPESAAQLALDDVRYHHDVVFRPGAATLLVAGDLQAAEVQAALEETFGGWQVAGEYSHMALDAPEPEHEGLRVFVVDRPDAVQTVIRFVLPAPTYDNPDRVPLRMLNTLLGGSFTSRLNQNLREEHGYTYGAGSRFRMQPLSGSFIASSSVRADVTGASLSEFLAEFEGLRGGDVAPAEVEKARMTLRTSTVRSIAGLEDLLGGAAELLKNGLAFETLARDVEAMRGVDAARLNALAGSALPLERGVLVLVGDKPTILSQLEGLEGLEAPIEVDLQGNPMQ